ncbi:MAG TPA: hypothetical protein VKA74_07855, partial [Myxococcota bacterium]|nr:hypothetical protein [Myxococcota bacterium]
FDRDVQDRSLLEATIRTHAEAVARRLRRQDWLARTVVLKWRPGRRRREGPRGYPVRTRRRTLAEPTDDGRWMACVASSLLHDAIAEPVRLVGVGVSGLVEASSTPLQMPLFETEGFDTGGVDTGDGLGDRPGADAEPFGAPARARRRELDRALDQLADRFGDGVVRRASQADAHHATLSGQWKKGSRDAAGIQEEGER